MLRAKAKGYFTSFLPASAPAPPRAETCSDIQESGNSDNTECAACNWNDQSSTASVAVTGKDFTVSPLNADVWDGNQGTFSVTITGGTASSYKWSFTSPAAAGNNPNVNFSASTSAQTNTDSHWFALPDVDCPFADRPGAPARLAPYTIKASVVFQGDANPITHTAILNSDFVWVATGRTGQASITGQPSMAPDSNGVWHMTGMGSGTGGMARVLPANGVLVTPSSQFYNKSYQHEQVHVNQWVPPNGLVSDLYIPSALFSQVQSFTGTSQADLVNQYNNALNIYSNAQVNIFVQRKNALEKQAYDVSDAIDPKYMIQNCQRY